MGLPILAVVGALGNQGSGVISLLTSPAHRGRFAIRALTSDPASDAATKFAATDGVDVLAINLTSGSSVKRAFEGAEYIFANTAFHGQTLLQSGAEAAKSRETQQGLIIAQAAAATSSLRHLVWSTLPDAFQCTGGRFDIPHFQSKIAAEQYLLDPGNGLVDKTTFLRVGFYGSNLLMDPYKPVSIVSFSSIMRSHSDLVRLPHTKRR